MGKNTKLVFISVAWSAPIFGPCVNLNTIEVLIHAGYTDGHVGSFKPLEVVPMRVSLIPDGSKPYPEGVGPGIFYLPTNGVSNRRTRLEVIRLNFH